MVDHNAVHQFIFPQIKLNTLLAYMLGVSLAVKLVKSRS